MDANGTFTQANRPVAVATPLGPDALLLERFRGTEGVSTLFHFTLDLLAESGTLIPFDQVLGAPLSVRITDASGSPCYFHGICSRLREGPPVAGPKGVTTFVRYQAEMVPQLWLWSRNNQSRIFQHLTVVDILKIVLQGLPLSVARLHGTYLERTYCTQYHESDFAFACRLMEEEGIAYHFEHAEDSHVLVLTDDNTGFPSLPEDRRSFELRPGEAVPGTAGCLHAWEKAQEICAGKFTLRDHSFELPGSDLEERQSLRDAVAVGSARHVLRLTSNADLEVFEYPAGHAAYFDEIDAQGAAHPEELEKVRQDGERRARLRMEQEAVQCMRIEAAGNSAHCQAGFKFRVTRHGQPLGTFLLARVARDARLSGAYRGGHDGDFTYENRLECLPDDLKYRAPSLTPRPRIQGTQTAIVVGLEPGGIFTDKYGRVKVQFHWDRQGKKDVDSSCWIRVLQPWAGQGWGSINLPRAGQEVVVDFLEGDPDRPIILGSVYNAEQMPPYPLPEQRTLSGVKSRSLLSANPQHSNEFRFDDTPGAEQIVTNAQYDLQTTVEHDFNLTVDHNSTTNVGNGPATMSYLCTWNNVEVNKLTKSVVSSVSHADSSALKLNGYGIQFTGVGVLDAEIDTLKFTGVATVNAEVDVVKYEKVIKKKWESCGAKALSTKNDSVETVGGDHSLQVGGDLTLRCGRQLTIKSKINPLTDPTLPPAELINLDSEGEMLLESRRNLDLKCGTGVAQQEAQINLADPGKVEILGQTITLSATDKIILRAPQVVIQGQSDQILYSIGYEAVDDMLAGNVDNNSILNALNNLVIGQHITALELAAIRLFYNI